MTSAFWPLQLVRLGMHVFCHLGDIPKYIYSLPEWQILICYGAVLIIIIVFCVGSHSCIKNEKLCYKTKYVLPGYFICHFSLQWEKKKNRGGQHVKRVSNMLYAKFLQKLEGRSIFFLFLCECNTLFLSLLMLFYH